MASADDRDKEASTGWPPAWLSTLSPAKLPPDMRNLPPAPTATARVTQTVSNKVSSFPDLNLDELIQRAHSVSTLNVADRRVSFRAWSRADGTVFDGPFAFAVETSKIIDHEVPEYLLAAGDNERGYCFAEVCSRFSACSQGQRIIFMIGTSARRDRRS